MKRNFYLLLIILLLAIFAFIYFIQIGTLQVQINLPISAPSNTPARTDSSSSGTCKNTGKIKFDFSPLRVDDLGFIEPMGLMIGSSGHVTPIDHQYWNPNGKDQSGYDVISPGDGTITSIQHMTQFIGEPGQNIKIDDYRFIIEHSCSISTIFIHVTELSSRIMQITGAVDNYKNVDVPVSKGEVIGKLKGRSFDFNVVDNDVTLSGFLVPNHYSREPWKIHTVDSFDYFSEPLRSQLLLKNIRTASPYGGKIDYDIDGKIAGNWFVEGTNGYEGNNRDRYWSTHLAIAYDAYDPSKIMISLGDFNGAAKEFGIKENSPDPANVGVGQIVKYELVEYYYVKTDGSFWDRVSFVSGLKMHTNDDVKGTVMLELIQPRKLKVEVFPSAKASDVSGFTSNSKIYER